MLKVLELFQESNYRYLHLSCHGTKSSFETTIDQITFSQFGKLVKPFLNNKRLFISSCESVNDNLANMVIPSSGCRSIVGPTTPIEFSDAAIMWASFYHLVFKAERKKITRETMESAIQKVVDTFGVAFNSYSRSKRVNYTQKLMEPSIE